MGDLATFDYLLIPEIAANILKYDNPKLIKVNKNNIYDYISIENDPNQLYFMGPTKYALAYSMVNKRAKNYLLVDNEVVVGCLTLEIDIKEQLYKISNVLVDRKYLGRGYGKALIKKALLIFSKYNCHTLSLYVSKFNQAALHTYVKCGFEVKNSFPNGYELEYKF